MGDTGGRGEGGDGPSEAPRARQKCVTWLPRPLVIYCVRVSTTVLVLCACAIGVRSHFVRESIRGAHKKKHKRTSGFWCSCVLKGRAGRARVRCSAPEGRRHGRRAAPPQAAEQRAGHRACVSAIFKFSTKVLSKNKTMLTKLPEIGQNHGLNGYSYCNLFHGLPWGILFSFFAFLRAPP